MNKIFTKMTTAFFAILLLTSTIPALAQEPGPGHFRDGPHHARGMAGMPIVDMLMRGVGRLDLSDEQRDSIKEIMQTLRTENRQLMSDMKTSRAQLRELIKADTFDQSAVAEIAGKEGAVTTERVILASQAMSQVYALLTDDQRAELQAMEEEHAARRAERRAEWLDDDV